MKTNNRKIVIQDVGSIVIELQRHMGPYSRYKLTFKGFTTCEIETSFERIEEMYNAVKELKEQWEEK